MIDDSGCELDSDGWYHFNKKPDLKIGTRIRVGTGNKYQKIADNLGIKFSDNPIILIPSGLKDLIVTEIKEFWKPKEGSKIHSWFSNVDYSDNPNFVKYWRVSCDEEELFYELADFLEQLSESKYYYFVENI